jgi:hypothetical protein
MVRLKKLVAAVMGLALIGVTLTLFSPAAVHATPPPSTQNVNVVNFPATTTVNGEVSIAGTPTVNVGNMPAVSISGTPSVTVANAALATVDAGPSQAVNGTCQSSQIAADRSACKPYTVPAGKRLVVEMISYRLVNDGSTAAPYEVLAGQDAGFTTTVIGEPNTYAFPVGTPGLAGGASVYAETRNVRIYLDELQKLILQADFGGANNFSQEFGFSGFLQDK